MKYKKKGLKKLKKSLFVNEELFPYFAYGSNCNQQRLEDRVGKVINKGKYLLKGFRLVFDTGHSCSFANIIRNNNSSVEGVIYSLTKSQLYTLDMYEGYDGSNLFYNRYLIEDMHVYMSINRRDEFALPVRLDYFRHLIKGARENDLQILYKWLRKNEKNMLRSTKRVPSR